MDAIVDGGPAWIRERPTLALLLSPWHLERMVTPAGVRVTCCAIVIEPDQFEQRLDGSDHDMECLDCRSHSLDLP